MSTGTDARTLLREQASPYLYLAHDGAYPDFGPRTANTSFWFEELLLKLGCHVWTDRISNGEKPLVAYRRVLASRERLSRMERTIPSHGFRRHLLLRGSVLFSSGTLVFLLGSSVPKSEQHPLGPFGGIVQRMKNTWLSPIRSERVGVMITPPPPFDPLHRSIYPTNNSRYHGDPSATLTVLMSDSPRERQDDQ
jgi:hypothetical protein